MSEILIAGGHTVRKRFWIALLSGFLFLGSLLAVFGMTGVAYAVPLSGFGEFTVKFEKLVGSGFKLYGGLADGAETKNIPVAVNEINHATITGLEISKTIPALGIRVVITSENPVEIDGLIQKATLINGNAQFSNLAMSENYVGNINDPVQKVAREFTQGADNIMIENGDLKTLYLFQQKVSLPGMKVSFEKVN
ncbi:DUF6230 family protein [Anoxybacteroides tepidamans]|uniref:DUF6230 family protein n=1 Tax=Anoxybacteroides tepidamans TaxID=265948 RepID=UPI00048423E1|nr:DUF6230 family protein [Anoxybacillus tepidamans]